jgi:uncharacterized protein DUF4124
VKLRFLILALLIIALPNRSDAKVYKWRDDKGKLHFTDSVNKIPPKYRKNIPVPNKKTKPAPEKNNLEPSVGNKTMTTLDPEIATEQTKFFLASFKNEEVRIYDFQFGYWEQKQGSDIPERITVPEGGTLPIKEGGKIGALFKIYQIESADTFQISMRVKAPPAKGYGAMREGTSVKALSGNYKEEMATVTIDAEKQFLRDFKIPGNFTFQFVNNGKVFRSQNIRLVWTNP